MKGWSARHLLAACIGLAMAVPSPGLAAGNTQDAARHASSDRDISATFGVFVGSNSYHGGEKLSPLEYADNDVLRFARSMRLVMDWEHTFLLVSPDEEVGSGLRAEGHADYTPATRDGVLTALDRMEEQVEAFHRQNPGKGVRLLVYVSAHGDGRGVHLEDGILTGGALQSRLQASSADAVVLVADSCFSDQWLALKGAITPGAALPSVPLSFPLDMVAEVVKDLERVGAVTASSYTREERTLVRGGLVTHIISSAMLGAADLDQDGRILYDELQAFLKIYASNSGIIGGIRVRAPRKTATQPPTLMDLNRLPQRGLIFPPDTRAGAGAQRQCFWIRTEETSRPGALVAEFCRQGHELRRLYLPQGTYRVQLRQLGEGQGGSEGSLSVSEGFSPVVPERLEGRWISTALKGEVVASEKDGAAHNPQPSARALSVEEASYLDTTPFQQVVPLRARQDARQWLVKTGVAVPLGAVGGDELLHDPRLAFTQEGPSLGISLGYDVWLASLGGGFGVLGVEASFAGEPGTQVGENSAVPVGMLGLRSRIGWMKPVGSLEWKGFGSVGLFSGRTLSADAEIAAVSLPLAPRLGLEAELGMRFSHARQLLVSLGPQLVMEPHLLGESVVWQPWLSFTLAAGMGF